MNQLTETVNYIKSRVNSSAKLGIVLGSGLGNLSEVIEVE